jgi:transposase-like protein
MSSGMTNPVSYKRHRFPPQIIAHAVWLYFRFPLSLRLVEGMLLERGIVVSYETVRRWALKFGPAYKPPDLEILMRHGCGRAIHASLSSI